MSQTVSGLFQASPGLFVSPRPFLCIFGHVLRRSRIRDVLNSLHSGLTVAASELPSEPMHRVFLSKNTSIKHLKSKLLRTANAWGPNPQHAGPFSVVKTSRVPQVARRASLFVARSAHGRF